MMKLTPFLILLLLILCPTAAVRANAELHVAADAADGGDGSAEKPFANLNQARDAIRAGRKSGTLKADEPITILIEPGIYRQSSTFELTAEDGGKPGAPVKYQSVEPQGARLQGGVKLDASRFQPVKEEDVLSRLDPAVRSQVRVCDLSKQFPGAFSEFKPAFRGVPAGPWLYVDDAPQTLARWPNVDAPNSGWATFSKAVDTGLANPKASDPALQKLHPGSFEFDDPRPARWNLKQGVWLLGYWTHDWNDEVLQMGGYDPARKVIQLAAPHHYGINAGTWGASKRRFYAMNTLDELDAPGEWYLDRPSKQLYYLPRDNFPKADIVLATLNEPLIKAANLKHVSIVGLSFEFSHGDGLVIRDAEQVEVSGCQVKNLARTGIVINGTGNTVRSCDLFNLGTGGISVSGGDRKSLTSAKNLIVNNHIHDYGLFQRTYAPGIGVSGCGQTLRQNSIHDAPHNAVLYSGNDHLFELNDVYRVVMETGDAGAFYTGRDWTSQGNVLRHNSIHDLGGGDAKHVNTMGVYLDDCDSGDTIDGNVFYKAGRAIMIGGGRSNRVTNNLVVDCPIGLHLDSRGMTWKQWNNPSDPSWNLEGKAEAVSYRSPPWSERYPQLANIMHDSPREPLHNVIEENVFVDCTDQVCSFDANVKTLLNKLTIRNNVVVNTTGASTGIAMAKDLKGFSDISGTANRPIPVKLSGLAKDEFDRRENAILKKLIPGFQRIPFEEIGLQRDSYRKTLPSSASDDSRPRNRR